MGIMVEEKFRDSTLTFALQALLARHEAYMADAERDRLDLNGRIERLEKDKTDLETENANKIEENRQLLDQLEMLNNTVSESDTKIRSLEASLLSSQQAVRRLEAAAARAEDAERHIAMLEEEQTKLHSEIRLTKEDARSHSQRCKEAQRGILDMQDQLERMEKEAKEERERHVEVIDRMERQREVEKQLDTAAGRLKGAAASKSLSTQKNGNGVVNHFVRDLLQDNANLQLGIAELREMLMNSNDEIQSLREQLEYHQPLHEEEDSAPSTLKAELDPYQEPGTRLSQELHIHHHYHVAKQEVRKPKKKRQGLTSGVFFPPISTSMAQASIASSSTDGSKLPPPDREQTATAPPQSSWTPFSNPSSEFASSVPSSPRSNRVSSLFDNGMFSDNGPPTSPTTSFDPTSPTWRAHHKRASAASYQSMQSIQALPQLDIPEPEGQGQRGYFDDTIHEEDEEGHNGDEETPSLSNNDPSLEDSNEDSEFSINEPLPQPRLHRVLSHESIMSLTGGLDIHTLKTRPSQMTLRPIGGPGVEAVMTSVTAQPTLSRASTKRSDVALRDHFAGYQNMRSVSGPMSPGTPRSASPASRSSSHSASQGGKITGGLGKLVGWRPWGGTNTNTSSNDTLSPEAALTRAVSPSPSPSPSPQTRHTPKHKESYKSLNRTTGINQAGSIPGFQQYWAAQRRKGAPAKVRAETVNHEILSESLRE